MNENEKFWIKESNKLKWFKKPTTAILKKKKIKIPGFQMVFLMYMKIV